MNGRVFHELQPVDILLKPKDEWIQSRNEEPSTGSKISSMRKYTYDEHTALHVYGASQLPLNARQLTTKEDIP
ncbi:hypothetical protein FHT80_000049 [Rhizobium sp. BK226]|nr:hypothetical protein [Rhizobium sp. BK226]